MFKHVEPELSFILCMQNILSSGKLFTEFIDGFPSPLNFLLQSHMVTRVSYEYKLSQNGALYLFVALYVHAQGDFNAVIRDVGRTDFPDQLSIALHAVSCFTLSSHIRNSYSRQTLRRS